MKSIQRFSTQKLLLLGVLTALLPNLSHGAPISEDPFSKTPFVSTAAVKVLRTSDEEKSNQQRQIINDLATRHFGKKLRQEKTNDLWILQSLLDKRIVTAKDRFTLQAMGVALGDLLAKELTFSWVLYQDSIGNTRSLSRGLHSTDVLFPITMISRRVEAGGYVNVTAVYNKALTEGKSL